MKRIFYPLTIALTVLILPSCDVLEEAAALVTTNTEPTKPQLLILTRQSTN